MLKCCKNKHLYDMKIYSHSNKITLYLIKYILIVSAFFHNMKIYFYSIKINLNSIKYIFITSPFFSRYQNIFLFRQKKIEFRKKHFYHTYIFFHSSKVCFYYMNFSFNTFLVSKSGLSFVFTNAGILLSACKLNNSTMM